MTKPSKQSKSKTEAKRKPAPKALSKLPLDQQISSLAMATQNGFDHLQENVVGLQARTNGVWNTFNVVMGVLKEKGLVSDDEFNAMGEKLYADFEASRERMIAEVRTAKAEGREVRLPEQTPGPLEVAVRQVQAITGKRNAPADAMVPDGLDKELSDAGAE